MMAWYNYKTGEFDYLTTPPADFSNYIPPYSLNLYHLYQELGDEPARAAMKVLSALAEGNNNVETNCREDHNRGII